ncbi:YfiT family bacillithiol transferase [Priestia taiwanensis]|uniref:Putative metal-dependent hydrolase GCM10007140_25910 n=1 Tax=Priestia taiwanensis TaxID=1347902 RepID=A0A917AW17_9BACI|nr:bacillithiol transferase BstA [Priestia taiwanensis]MBM7363696.1 putative damage-inducible protein DinB [Priestia taiwanensis]GGE74861.1 putative metal-dependent hydrolase [Priestia taiwanensis]
MKDERYPIGKFLFTQDVTEELRETWIEEIESLPTILKNAVHSLTDEQLDTPYRDGGWTVRQVVHHIADSHMNAYTRFKLALTEEHPTIKTYNEKQWALLSDSMEGSIQSSICILEGLHERWSTVLKSLPQTEFSKTFYNPEMKIKLNLDMVLALYAWHGKHHVAHITSLCEKMNWMKHNREIV